MATTKNPTRAERILTALVAAPGNTEAVAAATGLTPSVTAIALQSLATRGHAVARASKKNGTTWSATKAGKLAAAPDAAAELASQIAPKAPRHLASVKDGRNGGGRRAKATPPPAAEAPVEAPKATRTPKAPAPASRPAGGDVAATIAHMESVRPVSVQPATGTPAKRTRVARTTDKPTYRTWERGQLRDAVLTHLQGLPQGSQATVTEISRALSAQAGPVFSNLGRMAKAGTVVRIEVEGSAAAWKAA